MPMARVAGDRPRPSSGHRGGHQCHLHAAPRGLDRRSAPGIGPVFRGPATGLARSGASATVQVSVGIFEELLSERVVEGSLS